MRTHTQVLLGAFITLTAACSGGGGAGAGTDNGYNTPTGNGNNTSTSGNTIDASPSLAYIPPASRSARAPP